VVVGAIAGGGDDSEDDGDTVAEVTDTAAPTAEAEDPTAEPTPEPTAEPRPEPEGPATSFGGGNQEVNVTIAPGTYRGNQDSDFYYWERLSGFSGELENIIANGNTSGPEIVTIDATDVGFNSDNCGEWTQGLTPITASQTDPFGEGTYAVGIDIAAGTWSAEGGDSCTGRGSVPLERLVLTGSSPTMWAPPTPSSPSKRPMRASTAAAAAPGRSKLFRRGS